MKTLNRSLIVGHVGIDPVMKLTQAGDKKFLPTSVATHTFIPQKEGDPKKYTEWHSVVFWNVLADLAHKMLHKGTPVLVEGRLRTYKSHDDANNIDRYNTVIVADNFIVLDKRSQADEPTEKEMEEADIPN